MYDRSPRGREERKAIQEIAQRSSFPTKVLLHLHAHHHTSEQQHPIERTRPDTNSLSPDRRKIHAPARDHTMGAQALLDPEKLIQLLEEDPTDEDWRTSVLKYVGGVRIDCGVCRVGIV